jgi:hypothetical protein
MVHSSQTWEVTGPDGSLVIFTYVQTSVGNFAYRQRGNITTSLAAIAADLSNEEVEALLA